ncbi:MAG: nickel-type superoxide dismutase maturation protease [Caldilineaceae bacterium]|nr:nickel-type superoxide dismutase maturation protease [Caldilineaceae bacterium]
MSPPVTPLPTASLGELLLWLLRRRVRKQVTGDSMLPTLRADDMVLVDPRAYRRKLPQPDEIVIARHPFHRDLTIIKRIAEITPDRRCVLLSDNAAAGSDSRAFGPLSPASIIGRVTCRILANG